MRCCCFLCLRLLGREASTLPACPREEPTAMGKAMQPSRELGAGAQDLPWAPGSGCEI